MSLTVALSPAGLDAGTLDRQAVLVVDVFRASTSIITALANGARAVIPVADKGEAGRLAASLDRDVSVLAGEAEGEQLAGFDLGNSPRSFSRGTVEGRTVVLTTTNGTAALVAAKGAQRLAVGALANASAATAFLAQALDNGLDTTILCAGWHGHVALEDTLCAGLLVDRLRGHAGMAPTDDGARIASSLYRGAQADLDRVLRMADHAKRLVELGAGDDLDDCVCIDETALLPTLRDARLVAA